ncbi:hypothetical protein BaRGS_00014870, partial [Batillaria attramentaria]
GVFRPSFKPLSGWAAQPIVAKKGTERYNAAAKPSERTTSNATRVEKESNIPVVISAAVMSSDVGCYNRPCQDSSLH